MGKLRWNTDRYCLRHVTILLLFIASMKSFAGIEVFNVTHVGVDLSQQTLFVGVSPSSKTSSCIGLHEFKWKLNDSGVKEIQSVALAAHVAGKYIKIGVLEGGTCVNSQPTGSWVRIQNVN